MATTATSPAAKIVDNDPLSPKYPRAALSSAFVVLLLPNHIALRFVLYLDVQLKQAKHLPSAGKNASHDLASLLAQVE